MLQKDFLKNKNFWQIAFYALMIKNHTPSDTEGFGSVYFYKCGIILLAKCRICFVVLCHKIYC